MAYIKFDGVLDDEKAATGFVPFEGELDPPSRPQPPPLPPSGGEFDTGAPPPERAKLPDLGVVPDYAPDVRTPKQAAADAEQDRRRGLYQSGASRFKPATAAKPLVGPPDAPQDAPQVADILAGKPSPAPAAERAYLQPTPKVGPAFRATPAGATLGELVGGRAGPLGAGIAQGSARVAGSLWGLAELAADTLPGGASLSEFASKARQSAEVFDAATTLGAGEDATRGGTVKRFIQAGVAGATANAPALATGAIAPAMSILGAQSFGSAYGEGKDAGLSPGLAFARAIPVAAFEVGTELLPAMRLMRMGSAAARGQVEQTLRQAANAMVADIPGEQVNAIAGFLIDKAPGIGIRPDATAADLRAQLAEALYQTLAQGVIMGGAGAGAAIAGRRDAAAPAEEPTDRLNALLQTAADARVQEEATRRAETAAVVQAPNVDAAIEATAAAISRPDIAAPVSDALLAEVTAAPVVPPRAAEPVARPTDTELLARVESQAQPLEVSHAEQPAATPDVGARPEAAAVAPAGAPLAAAPAAAPLPAVEPSVPGDYAVRAARPGDIAAPPTAQDAAAQQPVPAEVPAARPVPAAAQPTEVTAPSADPAAPVGAYVKAVRAHAAQVTDPRIKNDLATFDAIEQPAAAAPNGPLVAKLAEAVGMVAAFLKRQGTSRFGAQAAVMDQDGRRTALIDVDATVHPLQLMWHEASHRYELADPTGYAEMTDSLRPLLEPAAVAKREKRYAAIGKRGYGEVETIGDVWGRAGTDPKVAAALAEKHPAQFKAFAKELLRVIKEVLAAIKSGKFRNIAGTEKLVTDLKATREIVIKHMGRLAALDEAARTETIEAAPPPAEEPGPAQGTLFSLPAGTEALLNIGMDVAGERTKPLTVNRIRTTLKANGVKVLAVNVRQWDTEQTAVVRISAPLGAQLGDKVSSLLQQEAIAQLAAGNKGSMFGPKKDAWGDFNPEYFLMPDGTRASAAIAMADAAVDPEFVASPTISTRNAQGVNREGDPLTAPMHIDLASSLRGGQGKRLAAAIKNYRTYKPDPKVTSDEDIIEQFVEHLKGNLIWLYKQIPEEIRAITRHWYVGANKIARQLAEEYDVTLQQAAAVLAATSPQNDWYNNVAMARKILDIMKNKSDFVWDDAMSRTASRIFAKRKYDAPKNLALGKSLSQISDPGAAALWIRTYDQTYGSTEVRLFDPLGRDVGVVRKKNGKLTKYHWNSLGPIARSVMIVRDGSKDSISANLSDGHKVRSFYNNIVSPNDAFRNHVTIDTHAVAVAHLLALSGESLEVNHNFGGTVKGWPGAGGSDIVGSSGSYGLYHEAYVRAAAELDASLLPRELQSILWDAGRTMFLDKQALSDYVAAEWALWKEGKQSIDAARESVLAISGRIDEPEWKTLVSDQLTQVRAPGNAGQLARPVVGREPGRPDRPGGAAVRAENVQPGTGEADDVARGTPPAAEPVADTPLDFSLPDEGQTETPEFKRWFGDSKVVDAEGKPLVVYHGTGKSFDRFKGPSYFTDDAGFAGVFAETGPDKKPTRAPNIVPAYLRIENPYEIDGDAQGRHFEWDKADVARMKARGYDGVIIRAKDASAIYTTFDPEQIKSAIGNRGTFDPTDPRINFSLPDETPAPPFYSALARAVESINAKAMAPGDWRVRIKSLVGKQDVKADEIEWTGVDEWLQLQPGKVTKQQVTDYLNANGVKVEEVTLGGANAMPEELHNYMLSAPSMPQTADRWTAQAGRFEREAQRAQSAGLEARARRMFLLVEQANQMAEQLETDSGRATGATKFSKYTLPGGTNYREVLLVLPLPEQGADATQQRYLDLVAQGVPLTEALERAGGSAFASTHWKQPNVLAHVRLNDRTDADGKRVLFIEEIQSDWAQKGRKQGFQKADLKKPVEVFNVRTGDTLARFATGLEAEAYIKAQDPQMTQLDYLDTTGTGGVAKDRIPAAPFVTKTDAWVALALKGILRIAAEEGYDKVAFINGEQSADRYDLSQTVEQISWSPSTSPDGDKTVRLDLKRNLAEVLIKDGTVVRGDMVGSAWVGRGMDEIVGKELAKRIASYTRGTLKGGDLKVGGEGMRAFYDKIVPSVLKDVLKKVGGGLPATAQFGGRRFEVTDALKRPAPDRFRVTEVYPDGARVAYAAAPTEARAQAVVDRQNKSIADKQVGTQPAVDITPAMRETIMGGMPLFSLANPLNSWNIPDETRARAMQRVWQDNMNRVNVIQQVIAQQGGKVGEAQDVYRAEERMHGRVQSSIERFKNKFMAPLSKKLTKAGLTFDDLAIFAYAMHAPERNAHIARINPKIGPSGAGMSNDDAQAVIDTAKQAGLYADLLDAQQDLMSAAAATRRILLDEGLIDQDTHDAWDAMYQNYVPLRGFEGVDDEGKPIRGTAARGINIRGAESVRAMGRNSKAGRLVENVIADYERAVVRAERNTVWKTFFDLVTSNPDPSLWEVDPVKTTRTFDKKRDLVIETKVRDLGEDTVAGKLNGRVVAIKVKDPVMLRALRKTFMDETGAVQQWIAENIGWYSQWIRNTVTRFNPVFMAGNIFRDVQAGSMSVLDTLGAGAVGRFAGHLPNAWAAAWRSERDTSDPAVREWDKWFEEFKNAGAITGGFYARDAVAIGDELRAMVMDAGGTVEPAGKGLAKALDAVYLTARGNVVGKMAARTLGLVEALGSTSENMTRVAIYRTAREMGKSPAEAASIAKNATTNFNRKGEIGIGMNALYLFFNASVQGSARTLQALRNPKVQAAAAAMTGVAFAVAMGNADWGGEDEDGKKNWDRIPDHEKERNFIVMLPPGADKKPRYIKVPAAYGFNVFHVLGNSMSDVVRNMRNPAHGKTAAKAGINMVSAVMGSFNPVSGNQNLTTATGLGQAFAPTILDLPLQVATETGPFGKPSGPPKSEFDARPDSERFSLGKAGSPQQRIAEWLNAATGGDKARSGKIDITPGTIETITRGATGGVGTLAMDVLTTASQLAGPTEPVNERNVPFMKLVYGVLDEKTTAAQFYENAKEIREDHRQLLNAMKLGIKVDLTDPKNKALLLIGGHIDKVNQYMTDLRKWEVSIIQNEKLSEAEKKVQRKQVEQLRTKLQGDFNKAFNTIFPAAR